MKILSDINKFIIKNKGKWWFLVLTWILVVVVTRILDTKILLPPKDNPDMDITYCFIQTTPYRNTYKGNFDIKYKQEKDVNGIQIRIRNKGNKESNHFEVNFHIKTASVIMGQFGLKLLVQHLISGIIYQKEGVAHAPIPQVRCF